MKKILLTKIQFPEIELRTRDAHKLRGYFGTLFKEHSHLLHNHYDNGELRYQYPLVQYKVLNKTPTLVAIEEGAKLLTSLFLEIDSIQVDGRTHTIHSKQIENTKVSVGYTDALQEYQFNTFWMGLNQANHKKYLQCNASEKEELLNKILIGNILSLYKNLDIILSPDQKLIVKHRLSKAVTKFKNRDMTVFSGKFITNALLPDDIGLGKSVSRGFGSIQKI